MPSLIIKEVKGETGAKWPTKSDGLPKVLNDRPAWILSVVTYEDLKPDIGRILCSQPISQFLTSSGTSGGERKLMPTIDEELERRSLLYSQLMPVMSQFVPGLDKGKGMQHEEVVRVGSVFASGFNQAIQFLEKHWGLLCRDIRTGTIDSKITDPNVREAISKVLKPNPKLADFVEAECSKGDALPLVCTMYGSSECYFGINLDPLCSPSEDSDTLIPTMAYFEFLPVSRKNELTGSMSESTALNDEQKQKLVDLVDVELGQEYELVVTTYAVGDILRVSGFKNNAPQFNFICRKNVVFSIDSYKTDEVELKNAVKNAANQLVQFEASLDTQATRTHRRLPVITCCIGN
ncbi:Indole-3-acetic acid-amido synthetase GH3.6 [Hibiscus syriacus]|uniref:Indole-3-acetic acid-amido synthetase GH3.6 n=1 Tax=Hibiscus syriacus TaxID=106335 RepID=A0A6A2XJT7_HIBSY|nr:Indole-3-acetic acid-amido synthetase GH3.6 [Hibiscus syriacus]